MGFFSDAQGKLTPQSIVGSGRNSNSTDMNIMVVQAFTVVLVTCKNEEIQSKIKALEC